MKKLFLSAFLAVSALAASAQQTVGTFAIEPHVGFGYSTISNYGDIDGGISMEIGADAIYKFTDSFGASAGLNFYALTSDEVNSTKLEYNTLDIPLLAHFNFTSNLSAFAGFKFAFKLSAKHNYDGDKVSLKGVKSTRVLLPVGLKWTFNSNWTVGAQYNFSLTRFNDVELSDNTHISPIMLNVGYRFQL